MSGDYVIMGLPASGKTTFLAALWHLVESNEKHCRLSLKSFEGDLKYLNKISEAWRRFEPLGRTSQVGDTDVTIHLTDSETGHTAAAFFPDLAGESFDTQVEDRKCRPKLVEGINCDGGLLFFLSADTKEDVLSVTELNARLAFLGIDAVDPLGETGKNGDASFAAPAIAASGEGRDLPEWEPKHIPTQVRIVQLLSDLLASPFKARPRRLALIISAWDLARKFNLSPIDWLAVHMPLVHQFLATNRASFDLRVYGVSAQGVDLANTVQVDKVAELPEHSSRIEIVGPDGNGHDLTLPLVWLMAKG